MVPFNIPPPDPAFRKDGSPRAAYLRWLAVKAKHERYQSLPEGEERLAAMRADAEVARMEEEAAWRAGLHWCNDHAFEPGGTAPDLIAHEFNHVAIEAGVSAPCSWWGARAEPYRPRWGRDQAPAGSECAETA